jgi:hypothetical protein
MLEGLEERAASRRHSFAPVAGFSGESSCRHAWKGRSEYDERFGLVEPFRQVARDFSYRRGGSSLPTILSADDLDVCHRDRRDPADHRRPKPVPRPPRNPEGRADAETTRTPESRPRFILGFAFTSGHDAEARIETTKQNSAGRVIS